MVARVRVGGALSSRLDEFIQRFPAGSVIFKEGDLGSEMFIIQNGQVRVSRVIGEQERELAVLEKGDFFGEMGLLTNEPRIARVEAVTHGRLLEVYRSTFRVLIENEPIMLRQIETVFEDRLKKRQASDKSEAPEVLTR